MPGAAKKVVLKKKKRASTLVRLSVVEAEEAVLELEDGDLDAQQLQGHVLEDSKDKFFTELPAMPTASREEWCKIVEANFQSSFKKQADRHNSPADRLELAAWQQRPCLNVERLRVVEHVDGSFRVHYGENDSIPPKAVKAQEELKDLLTEIRVHARMPTCSEAGHRWRADIKQKLQGCHRQLDGVDLRGADLSFTQLQAASCDSIQLQGANLVRADLRGANLENANLQGANLYRAQLHGACLAHADLRGANLHSADLTGADMDSVKLAGADLTATAWTSPPSATDIDCGILPFPKFRKTEKTHENSLLLQYWRGAKRALWGDGEEEDSDAAEETESRGPEENSGGFQKLLPSSTRLGTQELSPTAKTAGSMDERLIGLMKQAEQNLRRILKKLSVPATYRARALLQVVCNKQATLRVVYVHEEGQEALEEVLRQVSKIHTDEEVFWTFDYFEKELASLQKRGLQVGPILSKLADAHLKGDTCYTGGSLFIFLRASPTQMAADKRELESMLDYLQRVQQETVNKHNWDDVTDNFECFYNMKEALRCQRSRLVFRDVWADPNLRTFVKAGLAFQDVASPDKCPDAVVGHVKYAVYLIKSNYLRWAQELSKEAAAIDAVKARQASFFALVLSGISGCLVFVATLLSGLVVEAVRTNIAVDLFGGE